MTTSIYFHAFADELTKIAEEKEKKELHPFWRGAKVKGKHLLAFGAGTLAGAGAMEGANALSKHFRGKPLSPTLRVAAPVLGLAASIAYNYAKHKEDEELDNAIKDKTNTGTR